MSPHSWLHHRDRLEVRIGHHVERVPEPVEGLLIHSAHPLTADVAADLLRLDATLAALTRTLRADAETAASTIAALRAKRRPKTRVAYLRDRRVGHVGLAAASAAALTAAITAHTRTIEQLDDVTVTIEVLREFVIGLQADDGLLREAADGWQRDPAPPATVEVFLDEYLWTDLDTRRARKADWGGTEIDGVEEFGAHWRRDPDDEPDDLEPYRMTGTWALGYVPRTAEVYAVRRTSGEPHTLWLLGTGFAELATVSEALAPILPRMRGPNSLILAAQAIRAVQLADVHHLPRAEAG